MQTKQQTSKKINSNNQKSTLEVLEDQLLGRFDRQNTSESSYERQAEQQATKPQKKERNLFHFREYHEKEIVTKEIQELMVQIKQEIEAIKKADATVLQEVQDIQRLSVESLPEKQGVYHVRFLEIVLSILRTLRQKINESSTWLAAMISKKKKRGSLFMARSKKMGTQYSLSQELQSARSVQ